MLVGRHFCSLPYPSPVVPFHQAAAHITSVARCHPRELQSRRCKAVLCVTVGTGLLVVLGCVSLHWGQGAW